MPALSTASPALGAHLAVFRKLFITLAGFSFAINLLMLTPTVYMLQIYDRVLASRNTTTLLMLTLIMLGLFALEAVLEWVRNQAVVRGSAAMDMKLGARVFDAAFGRTLNGRSGSAAQALGDLTNIRQFLTGRGLFAFFDAPWTPVYLLVIFLLHPWLGAFGLLAAVVLLGLAYLNEKLTATPLGEANQESQRATHYANGSLRNAEVIAALGMLGTLRQRWQRRQHRMLALQAEASDRAAAVSGVTRFTRMAFQSGVLGLGALLVIEQQLTPGGMIAASILLGRALAPVDAVIGQWRNLVQARGAYARLGELLQAHPEPEPRTALPRPQGFVMVENLVAGPPGARTPVLKGIKLGAAAGMLVAVIGPSASGKSTLARALVGVWPPMNGTVRLDGADVSQWNKEELGPWLGYLPQDVELFEGTVAENIARFGAPDSARTVAAAQRAGVHDMILRLPQGYDTPIGEGGMALSGGQRQRIGLARAMYGDPALVVLDEPNANLDEAGDAALLGALRVMKQEKRTVFVITHRMNLLAEADAILVLANGTIQTYGPRDAVMDTLRPPRKPAVAATTPDAQLPHEAQA
ncbi:type I secretion system permease/ATPase [Aquabacterium sp. A08]|uniref:type I secretion system permease/ATPase n=1 Tax=Aquabacterium sp. A08 TaxID=2718532 RepID=UPI001420AA1F|nr:type I secretion system permease/ATPase [Aquabacterium sp. A08]NIC41789.1 type I secretion system permease/ATPase [Aquabacterium sp. A08]